MKLEMFHYYSHWLGYILVRNRKLSNPSSLYQEPLFLILFPPYIQALESPALPRSRTEDVNGFGGHLNRVQQIECQVSLT